MNTPCERKSPGRYYWTQRSGVALPQLALLLIPAARQDCSAVALGPCRLRSQYQVAGTSTLIEEFDTCVMLRSLSSITPIYGRRRRGWEICDNCERQSEKELKCRPEPAKKEDGVEDGSVDFDVYEMGVP